MTAHSNENIFGALAPLRVRPIPTQTLVREQLKTARQHALNLQAPQNAEPLVDAASYGIKGKNFYAHPHNPPYYAAATGACPQLYLRQTVAAKLAQLNEQLRPINLEIFLFDAWRPTAVQSYFYETWMPAQLRARHPDWDEAAITAEVKKYWSAPTLTPQSPAPHLTGGVVDLRLQWLDGEPLWFGSLFDEFTELAHADYFEMPNAPASFSAEEARANRRLLYWLMSDAGFAHHPNEWWHYSYGDQAWAQLTNAPAAFYGAAEPSKS